MHFWKVCLGLSSLVISYMKAKVFLHRIRNPRKSPKAQSCSRSELFLGEEADFRPLQTEDAKSGSGCSFLGRILRSGTAICSLKELRVRYAV